MYVVLLRNIDQNMSTNTADVTLGPSGTTTWQGLWTDEGIWILMIVNDDVFFPWYADDPPGANTWQYDKTELYFDVTDPLIEDVDKGPAPDWVGGGSGHYQIDASFADGLNDGRQLDHTRTGFEGVKYAFMVNDPDYIAEYFIPFSVLLNSDGAEFYKTDPTIDIGFDAYIVDRDPGDDVERIAVWANTGENNSAWNGMDDCGIITLEGAVLPVWIDDISLTGGEITENNGTLQVVPVFTPADATEGVAWSVEGVEGRAPIATIDRNGLVTAVMNGTVVVTCTSASGVAEATAEVTINGQIVTMPEINLIRNGNFDRVDPDGTATEWTGNPGETQVVDGVLNIDPPPGGINVWDYTVSQHTFGCNTDDMYWFSFVLKADEPDTFNVDFEDIFQERYTRYGVSEHILSNGTSDWTFVTETEWTRYDFDVVFSGKLEDTQEALNLMVGLHDPVLYIDSLMLYNENDYEQLYQGYIPVETIEVTSEGGTVVSKGSTLQLNATVTPEDATLTEVRWSVEPVTGFATIDESGLLTGDSVGRVNVIASAKDDSEVWNMKEVTVTWPEGIESHGVNTLKLYPNPAVNELTVVLGTWNGRVSIYNSTGQKIEEVVVDGIEHRFDVSGYADGVYFVKSGNAVTKFVK